MKHKKYKNLGNLAKSIGLPKEYGEIAELKAKLIQIIVKKMSENKITHQEIFELTNVPRSAVTGILNGSVQKVSIERLLRISYAIGMKVELKIKQAA
jgi:predicted XRE-type DNA-binding protein